MALAAALARALTAHGCAAGSRARAGSKSPAPRTSRSISTAGRTSTIIGVWPPRRTFSRSARASTWPFKGFSSAPCCTPRRVAWCPSLPSPRQPPPTQRYQPGGLPRCAGRRRPRVPASPHHCARRPPTSYQNRCAAASNSVPATRTAVQVPRLEAAAAERVWRRIQLGPVRSKLTAPTQPHHPARPFFFLRHSMGQRMARHQTSRCVSCACPALLGGKSPTLCVVPRAGSPGCAPKRTGEMLPHVSALAGSALSAAQVPGLDRRGCCARGAPAGDHRRQALRGPRGLADQRTLAVYVAPWTVTESSTRERGHTTQPVLLPHATTPTARSRGDGARSTKGAQ